jgi:hypothetical protein
MSLSREEFVQRAVLSIVGGFCANPRRESLSGTEAIKTANDLADALYGEANPAHGELACVKRHRNELLKIATDTVIALDEFSRARPGGDTYGAVIEIGNRIANIREEIAREGGDGHRNTAPTAVDPSVGF